MSQHRVGLLGAKNVAFGREDARRDPAFSPRAFRLKEEDTRPSKAEPVRRFNSDADRSGKAIGQTR